MVGGESVRECGTSLQSGYIISWLRIPTYRLVSCRPAHIVFIQHPAGSRSN